MHSWQPVVKAIALIYPSTSICSEPTNQPKVDRERDAAHHCFGSERCFSSRMNRGSCKRWIHAATSWTRITAAAERLCSRPAVLLRAPIQPGAALNVHPSPANVPPFRRTVPAHDRSCHQSRRARPFPPRACPQLLKNGTRQSTPPIPGPTSPRSQDAARTTLSSRH